MYKHRDYAHSARSRTFLCGTDAKDYSEYALEWMIDELVDDGDEIVCLRVIEKDDKVDIKPNLKYREEAQKLLDSVMLKNATEDKAISIIMELAVGKVQEIFQRMVSLSLIVFTQLTFIDPSLRALGFGRGHQRSKSGWYARLAPRIGIKVLSTTFPSPSHCCQAVLETIEEEKEKTARDRKKSLQQYG